jgi:hypothetical protein
LEAPFTDLAAVCEDRLAIKEALNLLGFAGQCNRYLSQPNSSKDEERGGIRSPICPAIVKKS